MHSIVSHLCCFVLLGLFSTVNSDGFKPNLETQLVPLLATKPDETSVESKDKNVSSSSKDAHHPLLMQVYDLTELTARVSPLHCSSSLI